METYLFKFSACLVVFWLAYVLFLERQNRHRFKRFYLLSAMALALLIPLATITYYVEPVINDLEVSTMYIPIEPAFIETPVEDIPFIDLETALWLVYGLGVLLFTVRFLVNLFRMAKRISGNERVTDRSFIYVLLQDYRIPHSFFRYIFFNKSSYKNNTIPKEVMLHEETHAKQLHSLDIIVIELLQIVFWFNPLIYILKHHIKLNHEFLADQAVLEHGADTKTYQNILLQFSSNIEEYQLSSAINYSSIKKRFTVMKTQTSKTRIWISSLLLLPIIAILFYSFAKKEYVEKENTEVVEAIKTELEKANDLQQIYIDGATDEMMQEYNDWMKQSNNNSSTLFIPVGQMERLAAIYDLMSEEQRNSVETHPFLQEITPDLYKVEPSIPTTDQFESWKNEKEFAIWLDGKHISNSELNNYKINDIAHYVGSSVNSNAKSKKLPQPFQFSLYTKDGFNKFYKEAYVSDYRALTKTYSNAINTYLKGPQTDNSELRIIKAQADKFYNQFTKEDLKKHNILPVPPVPSKKLENTEGVKEYIKKYKKYEALRISEPHYINKSEQEQKKMDVLFSDLGGLYFRLSKANKAKVQRPIAPIRPYVEITLNGKTYYKKFENLTKEEKATLPPPPPPPTKKSKGGPEAQNYYNPSFLEYIIEMEKEGASFYLDDKKISAKKAKSIATNNKGKSTEMLTQRDVNGKYIVKLSSATKNNRYARSIDLKILKDGNYLIDGIKATKRTFTDVFNQLHQDITPEIRNNIMNIHVSSAKEISNKEVWFIYNSLQDYGFYRIVTPNQEVNRAKGNTPFAIESSFSTQEKATKKQIAAYNAWAKELNSKDIGDRIVKLRDYNRFKAIYDSMSASQRKNAEPFPKLPPPPPPPTKAKQYKKGKKKTLNEIIKETPKGVESGYVLLENGESHYYTLYKGKKTYYNKDGYITNMKGDILPPPPPAPPKPIKNSGREQNQTLPLINGKTIKTNKISLTLAEIKKLKLTLSKGKIREFKLKIPGMRTDFIKGNSISEISIKNLNNFKDGVIALFDIKDDQDTKLQPIIIELKDINDTKDNYIKKDTKEKGGPNADGYENYSISEVKAKYIKKYKRYESLRYAKPHFIKKSKKDKKLMSDLWVELRQMYFYTLTKKEKSNLKLPITPFAPYVKINKDGKSYYKVNSKLTAEEIKVSSLFRTKESSNYPGLDLLDENDPIVIPIGTYKLEKEPIKTEGSKRTIFISISDNGIYSISKDSSLKNFQSISLEALEALVAKLSKEEIKNTFIFSKAKDSKKFRSKPSKSPEYQDDIEVVLVKDDIRFTTMEIKGQYREYPSYQLVLDNGASEGLKSHVSKLGQLFKRYGISNLTL